MEPARPRREGDPRQSPLFFAALGVAEGMVWWRVDPFGSEPITPLGFALVYFASAAALVGRLAWTGSDWARWTALALAPAAVVGLVAWNVFCHLPVTEVPYRGDEQRVNAWFLGAFAFLYIATPFAQIFQQSGRARFPYRDLFEHSWNNFFIGVVAAAFAGALWTVLVVWAQLFKLLGIELFEDVFMSRPFAYPCVFAVFGYGLALGRSSAGVIGALRRITLQAARVLLPLVAFVALLFALTLAFTGLAPLWETGYATPLLLALLALIAVLLNAVIEDGERSAPYPAAVRRMVEASICLMPLYAAIALHGTTARIGQHGLTPQRVYALIFAAIASVYSLGYLAAVVWRRPPWLARVQTVNVGAAVLVAATAILVQVWPLDPLRLSAESQARRLEEGRVAAADFDFATLQFELGHHGWAELKRLEALNDHPEIGTIAKAIEAIRDAESPWVARERQEQVGHPKAASYRVLPAGAEVPPSLLEALRGRSVCTEIECLLLGADLDGDRALEFCLIAEAAWYYSRCYASTQNGTWAEIGGLRYRGDGPPPTQRQIEEWLRDAAVVPTRPNPRRDLVLRDGVLEIAPQ